MTGADILTFFNTLVDDTIDSSAAYILMNNAKDKVEEWRDWCFLQKESSFNASAATIALPSDFRRPIAAFIGSIELQQIPFARRRQYSASSRLFYLDMANSNLCLVAAGIGTGYLEYVYQTPDLTASTSPVWPARFHKLIAFEMAIKYFGIDQTVGGFAGKQDWQEEYAELKAAFIDWDAAIQNNAAENGSRIPLDEGLNLVTGE